MSVREMNEFAYIAPNSIEEVLELLEKYGSNAELMAGGTDLIPKMKGGIVNPELVISLRNVKDLKTVSYDKNNGLYFGACVTLHDLERYDFVQRHYRALYEGLINIASTQIRNAGTAVGNICNAVPSADSAPGMLVLDARIHIASKQGKRVVPITEFFTGVCKTILLPTELVLGVEIPALPKNSASCYITHTQRRALDLSMAGVACKLTLDGDICSDVKIALGAVAVVPKLAENAQKVLAGQKITDELIIKAADVAALEDCAPITDMRATKEYRRDMIRVLTKNTLMQARTAIMEG